MPALYLSMASSVAGSWGLAALGVAEDVHVELLEGLEGNSGRWQLQVDIGQFDFICELRSPELLRELAEFFAETFRTGRFLDEEIAPSHYRRMPAKQLTLGTIADVPFILEKDGKWDDRYFLGLGGSGRLAYIPTVEQTERLIAAVRDALADFED
jgi:hypothetical protein